MRRALLYRFLPLALCLGLILALRGAGLGHMGAAPTGSTMALGFLLIGGFVAGKIALRVRLPRITGYLLVGVVCGPYATGLFSHGMMQARSAVDGIAVALIALTAGGELRLDWLRGAIRSLSIVTLAQTLAIFAGVPLIIVALPAIFPMFPAHSATTLWAAVLVFTSIAVASSPAVAIAIINENRAHGAFSRMVLGATIVKDVAVILLFGVAMAFARRVLGGGAGESLVRTLAREVLGSGLVGLLFGLATVWYLRHVDREFSVFVLVICFAMWQVSKTLHLDPLLVALTAGFWVENFSGGLGHALVKAVGRVSLPVYALFFAAAGAKVRLGVLPALWLPVLILVVARAALLWAGTYVGARAARTDPVIRTHGGLGFISQAGVSLALASVVARSFPTWGAKVEVLIIAMIAVHELIGPPAFQFALGKSGDVGRIQAPIEPVDPRSAPTALDDSPAAGT